MGMRAPDFYTLEVNYIYIYILEDFIKYHDKKQFFQLKALSSLWFEGRLLLQALLLVNLIPVALFRKHAALRKKQNEVTLVT